MKYAIEKQFVMSTNSLDEYNFVIKFWNEDETIRSLFEVCIFQYTWKKIHIADDSDIRFFELHIQTKGTFSIEKVIIYSEKDLKDDIEYIDTYVEKKNVFMTLQMQKYLAQDNFIKPLEGILIKFKDPVQFSQSDYMMNKVYPALNIQFPPESLYLWFVEQGFPDNNIYYTHNYSIPA